jgi:hypothetical protein
VTLPEVKELQGDDIATAPKATGIYAWYYRPRVFYGAGTEGVVAAIGQFMNARTRLESEVKVRYGLRYRGESDLQALYGSDRIPASDLVAASVAAAGDFIKAFIQGLMTPCFAKPLYIGIAKVLFNRVYRDHYMDLCGLWESTSAVSRYLSSHQDASIHGVLSDLGLTHSFAIEARVRNLAPRDLVVYVCPTKDLLKLDSASDSDDGEDSPLLRSLEQVLQLLADPICGRR